MKQINKYLSEITFQQVKQEINNNAVQKKIKEEDERLVSYSLKSKLLLFCSLIIPIIFFSLLLNYNINKISKEYIHIFWIIIFIFSMIVCLNIYTYYQVSKKKSLYLLDHSNFSLLSFFLLEISVVGYSSLGLIGIFRNSKPILLLLVLLLYFLFVCILIKKVIYVRIYEELNSHYGMNINIKKWEKKLSRFPALVFVILFFGMQVYRMSKSLFIINHINNPINLIYKTVGSFGYIIMILCLSLLPTIFFNSKQFVKRVLVVKYAEELRKEYKIME